MEDKLKLKVVELKEYFLIQDHLIKMDDLKFLISLI